MRLGQLVFLRKHHHLKNKKAMLVLQLVYYFLYFEKDEFIL